MEMICRRCPHHVRHGKAAADGKSIEFRDLCGLKIKRNETEKTPIATDCEQVPFPSKFDYLTCSYYQSTFKSGHHKNDVVPKDIQYSEMLTAGSITDMDLL